VLRANRLLSIAITGVMPLPAVRKSRRGGSGSGRTNSPSGRLSLTIVPGAARRTRWFETRPPAIALTVIVIRPSARSGGDEIEKVRQWYLPRISTPIRTHCPGRWGRHPRLGRITRVAASAVSGITASIRPRGSSSDHSGSKSSR